MLKRNILAAILIFAGAALLSSGAWLSHGFAATKGAAAEHGLGVKEYEEFHHVLHPLEHEALPKKDFKTIRAKAGELVTRGEAIVKLGVPPGVGENTVGAFREGLKRFNDSLVKFKTDAESGTDDQLKVSYSAVHDSFEMLVAMLPRE